MRGRAESMCGEVARETTGRSSMWFRSRDYRWGRRDLSMPWGRCHGLGEAWAHGFGHRHQGAPCAIMMLRLLLLPSCFPMGRNLLAAFSAGRVV